MIIFNDTKYFNTKQFIREIQNKANIRRCIICKIINDSITIKFGIFWYVSHYTHFGGCLVKAPIEPCFIFFKPYI